MSRSSGVTFVNISHPDDARSSSVKTSVRRHVMRDVGLARRRRPRHVIIPLAVAGADATADDSQACPPPGPGSENIPIEQMRNQHLVMRQELAGPSRSLLPIGHLPFEPDKPSIELLHFAMEQNQLRPLRRIWVSLSVTDASALDICLAYAALSQDQKRGNVGGHAEFLDSPRSALYYSRALSRVKRRLDDDADRISAGVFITILGMACQAAILQDWQRWTLHMDGLVQISKLRGGLDGLPHSLPLIVVFHHLVGASCLDIPPWFPLPFEAQISEASIVGVPPSLHLHLTALQQSHPGLAPVAEAVRLTSVLATIINQNAHNADFWQAGLPTMQMLLPASHYLLSMPRFAEQTQILGSVTLATFGEMIRLACLQLIAIIKTQMYLDSMEAKTIEDRFQLLLHLDPTDLPEEIQTLALWAVTAMAIFLNFHDRSRHVRWLVQAMGTGGISTSGQLLDAVRGIAWVHPIMSQLQDGLFQQLDNFSGS